MSITTILTQQQPSTQKLCSSLHDLSDVHNDHRGSVLAVNRGFVRGS